MMGKDRLKVIFFIDSFRIGGMHRQVLYLVKHLNKDIFNPIMCTSSPLGGLRKEYEQSGCEMYDLKWKRKLNPMTVIRLIRIIRSIKPDIVFINEPQNLFYYRVARLFFLKNVVQVGSYRALTFWNGNKNKYYKVIDDLFSKWLYSSSVQIIVNSRAMSENYAKVLNIRKEKPLQIIYNGSDFDFPVNISSDEIRKELMILPEELVVIMVARLDPWKDFDTFLEAAKIVICTDPRAKFLILGDGELRDNLAQQIKDMELTKDVLLLGERKDVFNFINASDISVLSTHGEGFSNSILECMALGKPVIATDVGGNSEELGITGESGLLIPPKSAQILAESILFLMRNESVRKKIGESAKRRIQKLCSIRTYVSNYESLFLRCVIK